GRATPSHSTLSVDGFSSSRLSAARAGQPEYLTDRAETAAPRLSQGPDGLHLSCGHSGWRATHGLTHARDLWLSRDGRRLRGEETLGAASPPDCRRFEAVLAQAGPAGLRFAVRFHLHPDVDAALDMGGAAVSMALKSGEIWVFRPDPGAQLALEPSVYLEKGRLKPRAARQIVLHAHATKAATIIGWTLAKAQDTPLAIRDTERDELPLPARA
ncbi:MAG: heparinase II/III-family protein, partial [Rhodobacterales bacterium]|nr:heparinase II/III-family protein [Rhodobacterales bacterium]